MAKDKKLITQDDIMKALDVVYDKSLDGIPKVSKPIKVLAQEYLNKYGDKEIAAKKLISAQISKCTTSGFVSGLAGIINLPVAIGADLSVAWYVQMRMIGGVAYIAGLDLDDDEVQTLAYACLAGVSVTNLARKAGIEFGEKYVEGLIKKIPGELITKINQKVGYRFLTKAGTTGTLNLTKLIPGVGAFVGGGFDFAETKIVANRAYKAFVKGDLTALGDNRKKWFDITDNSKSLLSKIEKQAELMEVPVKLIPQQGKEHVYLLATDDQFDDIKQEVGDEFKAHKPIVKPKELNKKLVEN